MIYQTARELNNELIQIRRDLHKIPELEFCEFKTTDYIEKKLDEIGIEHFRLLETGVVGLIKGKRHGNKTILIRADIDALPIEELNDVSYKSEHSGKMHACGHDAHTACLIGVCMILKKLEEQFCGNVKVVFQPAEEGSGGALRLIENGVMHSPDVSAAIALHVEPLLSIGTLQYRNGAIMASPDDFKIVIKGTGGHGACPEDCNNPIYAAAELANKLKNIVADKFDNSHKCVVSVCSVHAGTSNNIIPGFAEITGTARSLDEKIRADIERYIDNYTNEIANKNNCSYEFIFNKLYPPVINDKKINSIIINAAKKIEGFADISEQKKPSMTGDDFSYFAKLVPSAYFKLGVGNEEIKNPLHSPKFDIDENSLSLGAAVLTQTAIDYLEDDCL